MTRTVRDPIVLNDQLAKKLGAFASSTAESSDPSPLRGCLSWYSRALSKLTSDSSHTATEWLEVASEVALLRQVADIRFFAEQAASEATARQAIATAREARCEATCVPVSETAYGYEAEGFGREVGCGTLITRSPSAILRDGVVYEMRPIAFV